MAKISFRNLCSQESIIGMVVILTAMALFITGLKSAVDTAPYMVPDMIIGSAVILIAFVAITVYESTVLRLKAEPQDERSKVCTLKSARNAFIVAMLSLAAGMLLSWTGAPLDKSGELQLIAGLGLATYGLSYWYYKQVC